MAADHGCLLRGRNDTVQSGLQRKAGEMSHMCFQTMLDADLVPEDIL